VVEMSSDEKPSKIEDNPNDDTIPGSSSRRRNPSRFAPKVPTKRRPSASASTTSRTVSRNPSDNNTSNASIQVSLAAQAEQRRAAATAAVKAAVVASNHTNPHQNRRMIHSTPSNAIPSFPTYNSIAQNNSRSTNQQQKHTNNPQQSTTTTTTAQESNTENHAVTNQPAEQNESVEKRGRRLDVKGRTENDKNDGQHVVQLNSDDDEVESNLQNERNGILRNDELVNKFHAVQIPLVNEDFGSHTDVELKRCGRCGFPQNSVGHQLSSCCCCGESGDGALYFCQLPSVLPFGKKSGGESTGVESGIGMDVDDEVRAMQGGEGMHLETDLRDEDLRGNRIGKLRYWKSGRVEVVFGDGDTQVVMDVMQGSRVRSAQEIVLVDCQRNSSANQMVAVVNAKERLVITPQIEHALNSLQ